MPKKIDGDELRVLREAVQAIDSNELRERYRQGNFPRSEFVQDLDKRYRFDLFYAAQSGADHTLRDLVWGGNYKDEHWHTALKSCVPPVEIDLPTNQPATAGA